MWFDMKEKMGRVERDTVLGDRGDRTRLLEKPVKFVVSELRNTKLPFRDIC